MTKLTSALDPSGQTARPGWRTLAIASLAVLATFLDATALYVAFPDIAQSLGSVSAASLSWVLNGYTITFAALLLPAGKVADRVGHKRAFLAGSALFTLASLLCAFAPSVELLVAFRLAQAAGAAALLPSSLALVLRAFPRDQLPLVVAVWGAAGAAAAALGPTLGAGVVEAGGWRWVFLINLPVGLVTLGAGLPLLAESRDLGVRLPALAGVGLVAAGAALVSLGVVQSDAWGWTDVRALAAIGGGAALLALFVLYQRQSDAPVLDLDLFASANFRWANLATLAFGVAFTAMFFGSVLFLTQVWQWSVLGAGLGIAPGPLLVAALSPVFGRVARETGQRPLVILGGMLFALGGLWRLMALGETPNYLVDYLPSMLFTGTGVALCLPQLSSVVAQSLAPGRLGVGSALQQSARQFAGTLGVALTIALVGQASSSGDRLAGFDLIWWLIVAGGLATALLVLPLRTHPRGAEERVTVSLSQPGQRRI
jgi:EmrB/QacA subfamily drug resistance transporter